MNVPEVITAVVLAGMVAWLVGGWIRDREVRAYHEGYEDGASASYDNGARDGYRLGMAMERIPDDDAMADLIPFPGPDLGPDDPRGRGGNPGEETVTSGA